MVNSSEGRVFSSGGARTLYITIPADLAVDSSFPFETEDEVLVKIDDGKLIIEKIETPKETGKEEEDGRFKEEEDGRF